MKSISGLRVLTGGDVAQIQGKTLKIKNLGKFSVIIILEKENYEEVELENCEFRVLRPGPKLTFRKLQKRYGNARITEADIFSKISGLKTGFQLKNISNLQDLSGINIAEVQGKTLKIKNLGIFTATLVLESPDYADVEITGCEFEITKGLLKITGLQNGDAKIYDGSAPTPKGTPVLSGVLAGDVVNLSEIKYYTNGAGTDLPIKIQAKLQGADAGKYELSQELSGVTQTMEAVVTFDASKKEVTGLKNKFKALTGLKMIIPAKINGTEVLKVRIKAFKNEDKLEVVEIEEGIVSIGDTAFSGCKNLKSVKFPESVTRILSNMFQGSTSLKTFTVERFVDEIQSLCFFKTKGLEIIIKNPKGYDIKLHALSLMDVSKMKVPMASVNAFKTDTDKNHPAAPSSPNYENVGEI